MGRHLSWKGMNRSHGVNHRIWWLILLACAFYLILSRSNPYQSTSAATPPPPFDRCSGRYIYVHDLPSRFNSDLLRDCRTLDPWTDMCRFTSNAGLGPPLDNSDGVLSDTGWYATNQFALDVIFHNRMKQYDCLTADPSLASAVFVPYYAGLDVGRHLWGRHNTSARDSMSLDLVRWLRSRPEWDAMGGGDHFLVAGRITWDFRRVTDEDGDWGGKFLSLSEAKNMTVLVVESSPWHSNDFAIPYPSYFHPSTDGEVAAWQERMRATKRRWLFSFAGAPRPEQTASIRGRIIRQCRESPRCRLLDCDQETDGCRSPGSVMRAFERSAFCLQPPGDSYTRRSAFDAMVAGCVPVFFHPGSAYVQYTWHLPREHGRYSVFVPEEEVREGRVSVEEVLMGFGEEEVRAMREEVIRMIPRLVYGDPRRPRPSTARDAFDVAVEGVMERVRGIRERAAGPAVAVAVAAEEKYGLVGRGREHEWDRFFSYNDAHNNTSSKRNNTDTAE